MDDIYAGRLGDFDIVTTMKRSKPRIIRPIWRYSEIDLFNKLKACHQLAKLDTPQAFVNAIRNDDVDVVAAQIRTMLRSDLQMSNRLRRRCELWLTRRSPSAAANE